MGQYWKAIIGNETGNETVVIGLRFENGDIVDAKLMEQAWWDSEYVSFVSFQLTKKPFRVAWIGDYADEKSLYSDLKEHSTAKVFPTYDSVWSRSGDVECIPAEHNNFSLNNKYLINHDRKEFIDCSYYFLNSKSTIFKENDYVIHPLPLLTAIGNGLGMGDFDYHAYYGKEFVGIWAWDLLEIADSLESCKDYVQQDYRFVERNKYFRG